MLACGAQLASIEGELDITKAWVFGKPLMLKHPLSGDFDSHTRIQHAALFNAYDHATSLRTQIWRLCRP